MILGWNNLLARVFIYREIKIINNNYSCDYFIYLILKYFLTMTDIIKIFFSSNTNIRLNIYFKTKEYPLIYRNDIFKS